MQCSPCGGRCRSLQACHSWRRCWHARCPYLDRTHWWLQVFASESPWTVGILITWKHIFHSEDFRFQVTKFLYQQSAFLSIATYIYSMHIFNLCYCVYKILRFQKELTLSPLTMTIWNISGTIIPLHICHPFPLTFLPVSCVCGWR